MTVAIHGDTLTELPIHHSAGRNPEASPAPTQDADTPRAPSTPEPERSEPDVVIQDLKTGEPAAIPEEDRAAMLGADWSSSNDVAWVTSGDAEGFHILAAKASSGYEWKRIATLAVLGFETDKWIGNACLTSDEKTLAVVYAPRGFTNDETLFNHGAFGALVDLESGETRQLGAGYTLAYFNPGCGAESRIAFTQLDQARTRIVTIDTHSPDDPSVVEVASQITSAVPGRSGLIAAAAGAVIQIDSDGATVPVAPSTGTPYDLAVTGDGGLAYITHDGERATAYLASATSSDPPVAFATGELDELGITGSGGETVHVMGDPDILVDDLPAVLQVHSDTRATSEVSSAGLLAVDAPFREGNGEAESDDELMSQESVVIETKAVVSGTDIEFRIFDEVGDAVRSDSLLQPDTEAKSAPDSPESRVMSESSTSPVSSGSPCAIPRNNPTIQALQPNLAEVEWAADQAVRGNLSAQTTFPRPTLAGASSTAGTYVPPQIVLGILAQESNFWQASRYTVPGLPAIRSWATTSASEAPAPTSPGGPSTTGKRTVGMESPR